MDNALETLGKEMHKAHGIEKAMRNSYQRWAVSSEQWQLAVTKYKIACKAYQEARRAAGLDYVLPE